MAAASSTFGKRLKQFNQLGMNKDVAEQTWCRLSSSIDKIYSKNVTDMSFDSIYNMCYQLVLNKYGEMVYARIEGKIEEFANGCAQELTATGNEFLLRELAHQWSHFTSAMSDIKDVLMYLDRIYVTQRAKLPIYRLALNKFRGGVMGHGDITERVRILLLESIDQERNGYLIERDIVKSVICILQDLSFDGVDIYETDFEVHFMQASEEYYRSDSEAFVAQNTISQYLNRVRDILNLEEERADLFLSKSSRVKLLAILDSQLIAAHSQLIVSSASGGFSAMLHDNLYQDLALLYSLFSRVPASLDLIRDSFGEYIKQQGLALMVQQDVQKDSLAYVDSVLQLKDKVDQIVTESFKSDKRCLQKMQDSFSYFINRDNRCVSFIAQYLDDLLRKGVKDSDFAQEIHINKVISIFKFISNKDLFENQYKHYLSKRLLNAKSINDDSERLVLAKLKSECGYQYTSKLEGMFKDVFMSKTIMDEFKQSAHYERLPIEVEVQVLTSGYWPLESSIPAQLPPLLQQANQVFSEYFLENNNGKKLTWVFGLGTADVRATFKGGRHELNVSTYQACIMVLFNSHSSLTFGKLQSLTQIPEIELKQHLMSLCTSKFKILLKSSSGKSIAEGDLFSVNDDFSSKFKRIKIPLISIKEFIDDGSGRSGKMSAGSAGFLSQGGDIPFAVEQDRKHQIDAAIARILKARKSITHSDLVAEVTRQLSNRFVPVPTMIKNCIESLIEREYIERDKHDMKTYHYLA